MSKRQTKSLKRVLDELVECMGKVAEAVEKMATLIEYQMVSAELTRIEQEEKLKKGR